MGRLRLTSPGILLILAVASAGGIFLLDVFYLRPHMERQNDAALRQEAVQTEHEARLVLMAEQNSLIRLTSSVCEHPRIQGLLAGQASASLPELAGLLDRTAVDVAWVSDRDGRVVQAWCREGDQCSAATDPSAYRQAMQSFIDQPRLPDGGLVRLPDGVAMVARRPIAEHHTQGDAFGTLWLARRLDQTLLEDLRVATRSPVTFVSADSLPPATLTNASETHALWPMADDRLAMAWLVQDVTGQMLGYLRTELSVTHLAFQAHSARRIVLIMLSLSAGLVLLVILGTHILIAGPVIRLLKRLAQVESGEEPHDLSRSLHGEPLVLARRLESAFDRLAHMSRTDQLTGVANRRHFEEVLNCFYHQSRRYNRALSLVMIDIDFFKAINDTGGHHVGDELLVHVAKSIESACRQVDLPARLGGDEFAILLPETTADDAHAVAMRIAENVSGKPVQVRDLELNITLSVGVADLNAGPLDSPQAMLTLADRAMYAAKELGRNRIVQAHDLTGMALNNPTNEGQRVGMLCKKLAGLDTEFKGLFVRAVEEIVELLAQRNPNMAAHAHKVKHYSVLIAQKMELPERVLKRIEIAATLHDIGMIAMPDAILLSAGQLSGEQLEIMRRHPLLSVKIMEGMEFLEQEIPAVRYHHERFDGKGYPEGIAGSAIPLTARILAVADSFDAMTSRRTFRGAKSREEGLEELRRGAGSHFDPAVVQAFLSVAEELGESLMDMPDDEAPAAVQPQADNVDDEQLDAACQPTTTACDRRAMRQEKQPHGAASR